MSTSDRPNGGDPVRVPKPTDGSDEGIHDAEIAEAEIPDAEIPDADQLYPVDGQPRVVMLGPLVDSPLVEVGEYTYYDDADYASAFAERNILYHYGPERLVIGSFCSLATGVRFIMNGANHRMSGPSTFPFPIFGGSWGAEIDLIRDLPASGDTVVGNDVWVGREVMIMPGVRIGHGSVIAAGSVVVGDVDPYTVVGGNPARLIRTRFATEVVEQLLKIAWWDWPIEKISRNVRVIMSGSVAELARAT